MNLPGQADTPQSDPQQPVDVHVWIRDSLKLSQEALGAAERTLSPDETHQAKRYRSSEDRRDYIAAHDLLRRSLSAYSSSHAPENWTFAKSSHGKPYIANETMSKIEFSITHTAGLVACAVSSLPVGIDVERVKPHVEFQEIAQRYFTVEEVASLARLSPALAALRFLELWTLKEAFLKAVGCGLSGALDTAAFHVSGAGGIHYAISNDAMPQDWQFRLLTPSADSRLALALQSARPIDLKVRSL